MMYDGRKKPHVIHVTFPGAGRCQLEEIENTQEMIKYYNQKYGFVRYHKKTDLWTFERYPAWAFRSDLVTIEGRYHVAI